MWQAAMRVTVILTDEDGELFEAYCEQNGHKKSTLINRLIREHLENCGFKHQKELFNKNQIRRDKE
jgi:hypothetical protein